MERKGYIVPVLLETEANKDFLKNIPHRKILNLSMAYKFAVDTKNSGRYSAFIQKGSEEELHKMAISNIEPKCQDILEILAQSLPSEKLSGAEDAALPMHVVTNKAGIQGASSIFKPGVLAGMAEELGGNLFVLPSSIHECIVMLDNGFLDEGELADLVHYANRTVVDERERLSDLPMYYNRETGTLSLSKDKEGEMVVIDKA